MISKFTIMLAAVAAVSVFSGIGAVSAYAEGHPEFVPGRGSYGINFTTKGGGSFKYLWAGGGEMECESAKATGEIVNKTTVEKVVVTAHKCTSEVLFGFGRKTCSNNSEGNLVTEPLKGHIGYIESPNLHNKVGLELEGEAAPGHGEEPLYAMFHCTSYFGFHIRGHLIGLIVSELNKQLTVFQIEYNSALGEQSPNTMEGLTKQQLVSQLNEKVERENVAVGQIVTATISPEGETIEIKTK